MTKMTPDELADHLHKIATDHGAAITELAFLTYSLPLNVIGSHSYSGAVITTHDQAPRTVLIGTP